MALLLVTVSRRRYDARPPYKAAIEAAQHLDMGLVTAISHMLSSSTDIHLRVAIVASEHSLERQHSLQTSIYDLEAVQKARKGNLHPSFDSTRARTFKHNISYRAWNILRTYNSAVRSTLDTSRTYRQPANEYEVFEYYINHDFNDHTHRSTTAL